MPQAFGNADSPVGPAISYEQVDADAGRAHRLLSGAARRFGPAAALLATGAAAVLLFHARGDFGAARGILVPPGLLTTALDDLDVDNSVYEAFEAQQLGKGSDYVIMKMEDNKITVDTQLEQGKTWDDFMAALPTDQPRFAQVIVDQKLLMIAWTPDDAPIPDKVAYGNAYGQFENKCPIMFLSSLHVTDEEELQFDAVKQKLDDSHQER